MTNGIRFDSVTVAYDGTVVLDALDLTVEPGEVMALLGPSGSGKTTALRAVAGFVRPVSGRVFLGGRDVTDLPPYRRGVGMVVQQYALFPHLRVEENVAFGLRARKVVRAEIRTRVAEALEMVGMGSMPGAIHGSCPAGSSNGSPSRGRWRYSPGFFFWMNPSPRSTRSCGPGCWMNSPVCTGSCPRCRSSTSPMTRSRR